MTGKKIEEQTLLQIIDKVVSVNGPYYGGVVAYLNACNCLSLLTKLLTRLAMKKNEYEEFFTVASNNSSKLLTTTLYLADTDGDIFDYLRQEPSEKRDEVISAAIQQQEKYCLDVRALLKDVEKTVDLVKGSIKEDFYMIIKTMEITLENIQGIINFENKKLHK